MVTHHSPKHWMLELGRLRKRIEVHQLLGCSLELASYNLCAQNFPKCSQNNKKNTINKYKTIDFHTVCAISWSPILTFSFWAWSKNSLQKTNHATRFPPNLPFAPLQRNKTPHNSLRSSETRRASWLPEERSTWAEARNEWCHCDTPEI